MEPWPWPEEEVWDRLHRGDVVGFFDGSSLGNPGFAGSGSVLLNRLGKVIACRSRSITRVSVSNNEAEYYGLLDILSAVENAGASRVVIVGDGELILRQTTQKNGQWMARTVAGRLKRLRDLVVLVLERLAGKGVKVFSQHVSRSENTVADKLARAAAHASKRSESRDITDPGKALEVAECDWSLQEEVEEPDGGSTSEGSSVQGAVGASGRGSGIDEEASRAEQNEGAGSVEAVESGGGSGLQGSASEVQVCRGRARTRRTTVGGRSSSSRVQVEEGRLARSASGGRRSQSVEAPGRRHRATSSQGSGPSTLSRVSAASRNAGGGSGSPGVRAGDGPGQVDESTGIRWPQVLPRVSPPRNGWNAIDHISVSQCAENPLQQLEAVPTEFMEEWAMAYAEVLRRVKEAEETAQMDRALKWLLVLHQVLLRVPIRGGVRGVNLLRGRFAAWRDRRLADLVEWWETDKAKVRDWSPQEGSGVLDEEGRGRLAGKAEGLVAAGEISRAVRLLTSKGVASTQEEQVVQQMEEKHPRRERPVPELETFGDLPEVKVQVGYLLHSLPKKSAAGVSGMRNEYLQALGQGFREEQARDAIPLLDNLATLWANGKLPEWWYATLTQVRVVALVKERADAGGIPDCRPVAIGEVLRRLMSKGIMEATKEEATSVLAPQQVAVGVSGGPSKVIIGMRLLLEANPGWAMVKMDIRNAFNSVDRVAVLEALAAHTQLRCLVPVFHATLRPESAVFFHGVQDGQPIRAPFRSSAGLQQGDALSSLAMSVVLQNALVAADERLTAVGGAARACMDDVLLVGPAQVVQEAVEKYVGDVGMESGIGLQVSVPKSLQFSPEGALVHVPGLDRGVLVEGEIRGYGMDVLGVPVGDEEYVSLFMEKKVNKIVSNINQIKSVLLSSHVQSLWTILYYSLASRFQYWLQHLGVEEVQMHARAVDAALEGVLTDIIRSGGEVEVDDLTRRRWRLPAKMNGAGIRSMEQLAPAAFTGTFLQVASKFLPATGRGVQGGGFLPQLRGVLGQQLMDPGQQERRWEAFLESDVPTAAKFRAAWEAMREDIGAADDAQGEDAVLFRATVQAGRALDAEKGVIRLITQQREGVWRGRLERDMRNLEVADPRRASFLNADAFSRVWVSAWPCADAWLSNAEFVEVMATYFGMDSPACVGLVGKSIAGSTERVDSGGFVLSGVSLKGDGWRTQHDGVKWTVAEVIRQAQAKVDVEPYGLFAPLVGNAGGQQQRGLVVRRRQGLIPDLLVDLGSRWELFDVKTLHFTPHTYKPQATRPRVRAVELRAEKVPRECLSQAHTLDEAFNGTPRNVRGPVESKLHAMGKITGLVFGAFGEVSKSVAELTSRVAEVAAKRYFRDIGLVSPARAKGGLVWAIRRRLGMMAWKQVVRLRLSRLCFVGPQGNAAWQRRSPPAGRVVRQQWEDFRQSRWMGGRRGFV